MKPGYILLEIIISIALGALIGSALLISFFQVSSSYKITDRIVSVDFRAATIAHQLDKDISGAFIPFVFEKQKETVKTETVSKTKNGVKDTKKTTKKEVKKKEIPLEYSFDAQEKENNFKFLRFITSNPLMVYKSEKPRIAKVLYTLAEEPKRRGQEISYRLIRRELKEITKKESKQNGQEVASGIKSMKFEFGVLPKNKKDSKNGESLNDESLGKKKSDETNKFETFNNWTKEEIKKTNRNIPDFVTATISLWEPDKKRSKRFEFKVVIVADDFDPEEKKQKNNTKNKQQPVGSKTKKIISPAVGGKK